MVLENKIRNEFFYILIYILLAVFRRFLKKDISIWRSKTEEIKKSAQKFTNYEKWIDEWEKLMQEIRKLYIKELLYEVE